MAGQESHFTHFDAEGQAHMVDVAAKSVTRRVARAGGSIAMRPETLARIREGSASKGDVLGVARIAAIQAAKRTSELIPLAHSLPLTRVAVDVSGRPYLVWKVEFSKPKVGEMDTELFREWFQAFAQNAGITLHIENLYGENNHHIAETCYKGLARALRRAVEADARQAGRVPSTKGTLAG